MLNNFNKIIITCLLTLISHSGHAKMLNEDVFSAKTNNIKLQKNLTQAVNDLKLTRAVKNTQLGVVLVDITDPKKPKLASENGSTMFYAASLPKIVILLGAFHKSEQGKLDLNDEIIQKLTNMIRYSSNKDATEMMNIVGMKYIADMLQSEQFKLYDPDQGGGLWLGKEYAKKRLWKRDPMFNISHGATGLQVAKFYYLLATGQLLSPVSCARMLKILGNPGINHKFVKGIKAIDPKAQIYRKSGSWREYHSDSALIERNGHRYIAVGLAKNPNGGKWLQDLIVAMDSLVVNK